MRRLAVGCIQRGATGLMQRGHDGRYVVCGPCYAPWTAHARPFALTCAVTTGVAARHAHPPALPALRRPQCPAGIEALKD